jgi:hypothetical protein
MSDSCEAQGCAVIPGVLAESECQGALDAVLEQRLSGVPLTSWFTKDGALFVQPPVPVLESLVVLRVRLDHGGPRVAPALGCPVRTGLAGWRPRGRR